MVLNGRQVISIFVYEFTTSIIDSEKRTNTIYRCVKRSGHQKHSTVTNRINNNSNRDSNFFMDNTEDSFFTVLSASWPVITLKVWFVVSSLSSTSNTMTIICDHVVVFPEHVPQSSLNAIACIWMDECERTCHRCNSYMSICIYIRVWQFLTRWEILRSNLALKTLFESVLGRDWKRENAPDACWEAPLHSEDHFAVSSLRNDKKRDAHHCCCHCDQIRQQQTTDFLERLRQTVYILFSRPSSNSDDQRRVCVRFWGFKIL